MIGKTQGVLKMNKIPSYASSRLSDYEQWDEDELREQFNKGLNWGRTKLPIPNYWFSPFEIKRSFKSNIDCYPPSAFFKLGYDIARAAGAKQMRKIS
jgi:hypothetical protein